MRNVIRLIVFTFFVVACSDYDAEIAARLESPSNSIVSRTTDYPSVVRVILPNFGGMCSGTFISEKALLTAAHCTTRSGLYTVYTDWGTFQSRTIVPYGTGAPGDPNDLSLIIFNSAIADPNRGRVTPVGRRVVALDRVRIVGYGCNNLDNASGAGIKRTGTNQVYRVDGDHIQLLTPVGSTRGIASATRGVWGPENRAAACFGDSGGALFKDDNPLEIVGVTHAGSWNTSMTISYFGNLNRADNLNWLQTQDRNYALGINDVCEDFGAIRGVSCGASASFNILKMFGNFWSWMTSLFKFLF